jgi:hypothetical protein
VRAREQDEKLLLEQQLDLDLCSHGQRHVRVLEDDREVGVTAGDGRERRNRVERRHGDARVREALREVVERGRHERRARRSERQEPEWPHVGRREGTQLRLGLRDAFEDLRGMACERAAGLGEAHAPWPALEQRDAHLALELRELL